MAAAIKRATIRTPEGDEIKIRFTTPPTEDDVDDIVKTWKANKLGESRDISSTIKSGYESAAAQDAYNMQNSRPKPTEPRYVEESSMLSKLGSAISPQSALAYREGAKPFSKRMVGAAASDALSLPGGTVSAVVRTAGDNKNILKNLTERAQSDKNLAREYVEDPALGATMFTGPVLSGVSKIPGVSSLTKMLGGAIGKSGKATRIAEKTSALVGKGSGDALKKLTTEGVLSGTAREAEDVGAGGEFNISDAAIEAGLNVGTGGLLKGSGMLAKKTGEFFSPSKQLTNSVARALRVPAGDFKIDKFKKTADTFVENKLFGSPEEIVEKTDKLIKEEYSKLRDSFKGKNIKIDVLDAWRSAVPKIKPSNIGSSSEPFGVIVNNASSEIYKKLPSVAEELKKEGFDIVVNKNKAGVVTSIDADPVAVHEFLKRFKKGEVIKWDEVSGQAKYNLTKNFYFDLRNNLDSKIPEANLKKTNEKLHELILIRDLAEKDTGRQQKMEALGLSDIITAGAIGTASTLGGAGIALSTALARKFASSPKYGQLNDLLTEFTIPGKAIGNAATAASTATRAGVRNLLMSRDDQNDAAAKEELNNLLKRNVRRSYLNESK
jgi:hypothetical protein